MLTQHHIDVQHAGLPRVWADLVGDADEHIYGGGEQYTYLDLKVRGAWYFSLHYEGVEALLHSFRVKLVLP
jgi:hypothetical protein